MHSAGAVFLDFVCAFDSVWHEGLLYKIGSFGINPNMIDLIGHYLGDITFSTKVDNVLSERLRILVGVPQGPFLDPELFILYAL